MKTGKTVWSHALPGGSESSPLVHGLSVFLGDQGGTVYSFRTYDGHVNWTFGASGSVKGGVAFAHGTIYFGDYGGHVYARERRQRPGGLVGRRLGHGVLDARGRVRTGLRGHHGGRRGCALGELRRAVLERLDRHLRLLLPGGRRRAGTRADRLHRVLRRQVPRLRRRQRRRPLEPLGRRDGSTARRRSSATSSTTRRSDRTRPKGSTFAPAARCSRSRTASSAPVITDGKAVFLIGFSTIYQMLPEALRPTPARGTETSGRARLLDRYEASAADHA